MNKFYLSNANTMHTPEKLIDLKEMNNFFLNLSHGDMMKENALKSEFINELLFVEQTLKKEMDLKNWDAVHLVILRVKTVFHITEQKHIADFFKDFPNLTSTSLNRVQKDMEVEKILKLLAYIIAALKTASAGEEINNN